MSVIRISTALAFAVVFVSACMPTPQAHAGSPSFDCAKTDSRAEELVCGDRELARMDVEATRLFKLVRDNPDRSNEEKQALNDDRQQWMKSRNECWIEGDIRTCVISAYAQRIHVLREKHEEARVKDVNGITKGPYAWRCKQFDQPVTATFISSNPPVGAVQLPGRVHVGIGAGVRYIESEERGGLQFWTEGRQAYIQMPNGENVSCERE